MKNSAQSESNNNPTMAFGFINFRGLSMMIKLPKVIKPIMKNKIPEANPKYKQHKKHDSTKIVNPKNFPLVLFASIQFSKPKFELKTAFFEVL
ncbi:hypothetical protein QLS71_012430 [Mariniflexile litorale]|uniref:Uncharacterized protein n=1 Tax=Mariniflexile litorale TaxID=3045158 RepID=A0AAU7EBY7_9FLAO|nr:hypothetical protein [Mariniflexile sp. KMM 9835]MDQ8210423.1 hypothetical protein [Mariniflexile sp. KMM 9835]